MTLPKRKGAKSTRDIPKDILEQLNRGVIETANLVEWLAIDQRSLLENVLRQYQREQYLPPVLKRLEALKKQTVNTINEAIGTGLLELATQNKDRVFLKSLATHKADLVRCWATYTIAEDQELSIQEQLLKMQPFAADPHFGVREIAWLALRPRIARHLEEILQILSNWTQQPDEYIRRFASEATRPRGVWCEHIEALKQQPQLGLVILEPLKADPSRYVQDSVGNWLNDASKTQPEFVSGLCQRWEKESNSTATKYIVKKAMRTILK